MEKYSSYEIESIEIAENFLKNSKYKDSIAICLEVLQQYPNNSKAYNLLGINMMEMKSYKKAIKYFTKALNLLPNNVHYVTNFARALNLDGDNEKAIETLTAFLNQSNETIAFFDLAQYFSQNKQHKKAIDLYEGLLVIKPNNLDILFTLADEYIKNNDIKNSLPLLERAYNLGHKEAGIKLLNQYVKLNMACAAISFAKKYTYTKNADFYFLYANALSLNGNISEAKTCYKTAISMSNKPRYIFGYSTFLLKNREYAEGFKYYETRKEIEGFSANVKKSFSKPSDVYNKTVLVYYEQNLSDTIIFSRFLPLLQQIAKKVYFYPQKELSNIFDIECVSPPFNIDYDVSVLLPSLPYILNVSKPSDLDVKTPFTYQCKANLQSSNENIIKIAFAFGDLGKMKHDRMKLEKILDATISINVNLVSVKLDGIDSSYTENFSNIVDKGRECKNYCDILRILSSVDLFVGTDTQYLHLAASFGIPCILFKDTQRWIWENGKTTNWYKNLIILEPDSNLRWDNALKAAFRQIKKYASKH
ncbi:hypothetical protein CCY99_06060 [Helicobacter sp. 16-1353]|uniref:tetratricopeptide repeat protein n=1 Tax=Helicobacter sp. 16-1353 TaxID=2004996 RepID=UPI000DCD0F80|nr:tetratricopeptide repeat protein [Helicobacter sp. 16-1353]RAX53154.1 hypothetical protein CCY99_06060 [Helicobacter sp. 16-1353]